MTKQECLAHLKKVCYTYTAHGLLFSEMIPYRPENYEVLKQCQDEIPELRIYRDVNKFRLIVKI